MHIKKENIPLVIGLSIPVVMIIFIAIAVYLPTMFVHVDPPQYNFLYMINNGTDGYHYDVVKNKLTRKEIKTKNSYYNPNNYGVKFFTFDFKTRRNLELSFEEAEQLNLNSNAESLDGFRIEYGRRSRGFFPFYSGYNYNERYLVKEGYSEKLKLYQTERNYYNFRFLGWIIPNNG